MLCNIQYSEIWTIILPTTSDSARWPDVIAQQQEPVWSIKNKGCSEVPRHNIANANKNTLDSWQAGSLLIIAPSEVFYWCHHFQLHDPKWGQDPHFEEFWSKGYVYKCLIIEWGDWTMDWRDGCSLVKPTNWGRNIDQPSLLWYLSSDWEKWLIVTKFCSRLRVLTTVVFKTNWNNPAIYICFWKQSMINTFIHSNKSHILQKTSSLIWVLMT